MQDVRIYICCHKDYNDVGINNPCYTLITNKAIKNKTKLKMIRTDGKLDDRMWSELASIYHIWKGGGLQADWIGLSHYRRYFSFMNDIPELEKPIIAKSLTSGFNNYMQYDICHCSKDLVFVTRIIKKMKPDYLPAFIHMLDSHRYFPYNMFILPKKLFNEYCTFMFDVLFALEKLLKIDGKYENMLKHIGDYRECYIEKSMSPNDTYEYQARLFGFIAERLTTAFFMKYIHDNGKDSVIEQEINITEKTYNKI